MELIRPLAPVPPSWWTRYPGESVPLLQNMKTIPNCISVQRATSFQDLLSFASTLPINSRTSIEAMLQGTKIRMIEMRVKLMHKFPRKFDKGGGQAGIMGLTGATDLNRRHRVTLESTLGSDEDKHSMSAFISSKFEPRISWGVALSHKLLQEVTFFSRFNSDEGSRQRLIVQVVYKMGGKSTLSPILSTILGEQPQAGLSWTHQLNENGRPGKNTVQVKLFCSGSGAYSFSIKAQAGELDTFG